MSLAENLYYIVHADELAAVPRFADLPPPQRERWEKAAFRLNPTASPADFDVPGMGRIPLRSIPSDDVAQVCKILVALADRLAGLDEAAGAEAAVAVQYASRLLRAGEIDRPMTFPDYHGEVYIPVPDPDVENGS